jgi:hypothetical protein
MARGKQTCRCPGMPPMPPKPWRCRAGVLDAVSCVGTTFCMAVGTEYRKSELACAARLHGPRLTQVSTPEPAHARWADLAGVSCVLVTDCLAVGDYENAAKHVLTFAEVWNGAAWRLVPGSPNVRGQAATILNDVSCASASACVNGHFLTATDTRASRSATRWVPSHVRVLTRLRQPGRVRDCGLRLLLIPLARPCLACPARSFPTAWRSARAAVRPTRPDGTGRPGRCSGPAGSAGRAPRTPSSTFRVLARRTALQSVTATTQSAATATTHLPRSGTAHRGSCKTQPTHDLTVAASRVQAGRAPCGCRGAREDGGLGGLARSPSALRYVRSPCSQPAGVPGRSAVWQRT